MDSVEKIINSLSRRKAIRERCLNCVCWHTAEVRNCHHVNCPLHPFRMGKGKQIAKERTKAIKAYCLECMNGQKGEVNKCPSTSCSLYPYRKGAVERPHEDSRIPQTPNRICFCKHYRRRRVNSGQQQIMEFSMHILRKNAADAFRSDNP